MRILLVIDDLGSGGAQRQIVNLGLELSRLHHDIEYAIYHISDSDIFLPIIEREGLPIHFLNRGSRYSFDVPCAIYKLMRHGPYDAVISFLDAPNLYCELARFALPRQRLIVSERASFLAEHSKIYSLVRRVLHGLATTVVANSETQAAWLRRFPWLRDKVHAIYNGYPLEAASPLKPPDGADIHLLAVGRVTQLKNPQLLALSLIEFHKRTGRMPYIRWVGRVENDDRAQKYFHETCALIADHEMLRARWSWMGERADVGALMSECHALIHPSMSEGLPNVVCEALMAGRPAVVSNVCDNPILVEDRVRGLIIHKLDPHSIADAIEVLYGASRDDWIKWGENARAFAENRLTSTRMAHEYIRVINAL